MPAERDNIMLYPIEQLLKYRGASLWTALGAIQFLINSSCTFSASIILLNIFALVLGVLEDNHHQKLISLKHDEADAKDISNTKLYRNLFGILFVLSLLAIAVTFQMCVTLS